MSMKSMDGLTDADLWQKVRRGDGAAFGVVYDRHQRRVFGFCRRATGSVDAADDLTALVFLEAWRKRANVRIVDDSIVGWLLVTAGYVVKNQARSERRFRHVLSRIPVPADEPDLSVEVLDRLAGEAAGARTQQAFTMLSDRDREILTLCVLEELPLVQVSELLRVPLGTVKSRLSRAKSRLAERVTASNTGYNAERGLS
jgi:RNA polymerase sigma-70 factor (ECF subfamily)